MKNSFYYLISALVVLMAVLSYNLFDLPAALYFETLKSSRLEKVFAFITVFGKAEYTLIPAALIYLLYKKKNPQKAMMGGFVFVSVAVSGILVDIIKALAGRFRPEMYLSDQAYGFDFFHVAHNMTSFPSGHSATALGAGVALALLFPRYRYIFYLLAGLIMISRVVVVRHYPSDVLIGALIGALTSIILYDRVFKRKIFHV